MEQEPQKLTVPPGLSDDIRNLLRQRNVPFREDRGFLSSTFHGDFSGLQEEIRALGEAFVERDAW